MALTSPLYQSVGPHWFYRQQDGTKDIWLPFSCEDSQRLEEAHLASEQGGEATVATEGARFDVRLPERTRCAAYWAQAPAEVRRCTWFYKGDKDSHYTPYPEDISHSLEEAYRIAVTRNKWKEKLEFPSGDTVTLHSSKLITQDQWPNCPMEKTKPQTVKRGVEEIMVNVPEGEPETVDHLVFMVHGIGSTCDLSFRTLVHCVNGFRSISLDLINAHFREAQEERRVGRVEFLPVNWHDALHSDTTGVDRDIRRITLPSLARLRDFATDTVLDLFYYSSPTYCQTIVDSVVSELNRLHALFLCRNPRFAGAVSLAGHSLGSLILFDLLTNQKPVPGLEDAGSEEGPSLSRGLPLDFRSLEEGLEVMGLQQYAEVLQQEQVDLDSLGLCSENDLKDLGIPLGPRKKILSFMKRRRDLEGIRAGPPLLTPGLQASREETGPRGTPGPQVPFPEMSATCTEDCKYLDIRTGQVSVKYPQLSFQPQALFALGSPIGMFLTVRGIKCLDPNYSFPTCKGFYNIYHPFDPVAYRIEPMIGAPDVETEAVLIPHHKGRKRMHRELKEGLTRMSSDLMGSLRTAWQSFSQLPIPAMPLVAGGGNAGDSNDSEQAGTEDVQWLPTSPANFWKSPLEWPRAVQLNYFSGEQGVKPEEQGVQTGMLNGGRRVDYVLQETPIESFNEYLFALQSHLCYWDSEDTVLLVLKEIYGRLGIQPPAALATD
ncbi:phospholipase DDHD2-like [Anguilla rostrata]|uniref:phospholipase DDHD2-like n=1 Tax=Anguilla rostrata TaxID=7938 RepID=UPI0030CAF5C0